MYTTSKANRVYIVNIPLDSRSLTIHVNDMVELHRGKEDALHDVLDWKGQVETQISLLESI